MKFQWPRPACGTSPGAIHIAKGLVQVDLFRAATATSNCNRWATKVDVTVGGAAQAPLARFLEALFGHRKSLESLCSQVVRALAMQMDETLARAARTGGGVVAGVTIKTIGMQLQDDYQLELDLVRYREASLLESGGQKLQYLSASTDKSRVSGMGVANTCFAKPSNKAWWAPPVVTSPINVCVDGRSYRALC